MNKNINNNLLFILVKTITLLTMLFASSMTFANSCANDYWTDGQWYDEGDTVEFNSEIYTAVNENPGYNPEASPWFWDWQSSAGTCSYQKKNDNSCVSTPWTNGQWYNAYDKVSFDGNTYIAVVDNPGYNPTISTYFWDWVTANDASCYNAATPKAPVVNNTGSKWRTANITTYSSYPDSNDPQCSTADACPWMGQFKAVSEKMSYDDVKNTNIVAVDKSNYPALENKDICIVQDDGQGGERKITAKVIDVCADSDCDGCCSTNKGDKDALLDLERFTMKRFGSHSGEAKWKEGTCN